MVKVIIKKEHQLRKQEETKKKILDVARNIIAEEGIKGISIRKITKVLDYSPGIIYHYFKDKNELVETLVGEGYGQILASVKSAKRNEAEPEKEIKEAFTNYIKAALESSEYYKAVMFSDDPSILKKTGLLERGISKKNPGINILSENIERGIHKNRYGAWDSELMAQIIWTSTFGLVMRLMVEKDISQEQINRLIDYHFDVLFQGLMIRKE